jgi:hypothetical protein
VVEDAGAAVGIATAGAPHAATVATTMAAAEARARWVAVGKRKRLMARSS